MPKASCSVPLFLRVPGVHYFGVHKTHGRRNPMSDRTRHLIEGVRKFSPLLQAFEAGYTVEQVKASVHATLRPEFRNESLLDFYGIDLLTVEATNLEKLKLRPSSYSLFRSSIDARRAMLALNPDRCSEICADWEQEIGSGLHFFWNSARMEVDKSDLTLDEFAYEAFRNIGSLLEATMLPYLRELLHIHEELHGRTVAKIEIAAIDFGSIISRLEKWVAPKLLRPQPTNLPLNQWRNIAQHFSVSHKGERILCHYGRVPKRSFELTRDELWDVLVALFSVHSALRTAHTIFFLDHGAVLSKRCKGFERKDSDLQFQFIVGAASQGFEVTSLSVKDRLAQATLQDCTAEAPIDRGIHASQFVLGLWRATRAEELRIEYRTKTGDVYLRASASGSDCARVHSAERDMGYLASVVELRLSAEAQDGARPYPEG